MFSTPSRNVNRFYYDFLNQNVTCHAGYMLCANHHEKRNCKTFDETTIAQFVHVLKNHPLFHRVKDHLLRLQTQIFWLDCQPELHYYIEILCTIDYGPCGTALNYNHSLPIPEYGGHYLTSQWMCVDSFQGRFFFFLITHSLVSEAQ